MVHRRSQRPVVISGARFVGDFVFIGVNLPTYGSSRQHGPAALDGPENLGIDNMKRATTRANS